MEEIKVSGNKNMEQINHKPLLSQEEIDESKKTVEKEARLEKISGAIRNLKSIDDLDKKIDGKTLDILIAELIQETGVREEKPSRQIIFESILDKKVVEEDERDMKNGGESVLYLPDSTDTPEKPSGGGDGYFVRKTENGEVGVLFDTLGHGFSEQYKKAFMKKVFELLESAPLEKRAENIRKVDRFFENLFTADNSIASSFERISIKNIDDKKKIVAEFYGDTVFIVFDPEEKKMYFRGTATFEDSTIVSELSDEYGVPFPVGVGIVSELKEGGKPKLVKPLEMLLSKNSEVILSSDGVVHPKTEYSDGRNFEQVLKDFIKEKEINKDLRLVEYFRNSLVGGKVGDDITMIEIGAKLK